MSRTLQAFPSRLDASIGEAFCTSGTSPTTVHLVGPGHVGRAFLRLLPASFRLVGITDRSATLHGRAGLGAAALADHKARGHRLADLPGAESLPVDLALDLVDADCVVDATPSGEDPAAAVRRSLRVLRRGKGLAMAAKDALCHAASDLLADRHRSRVGIHAVLGGTGAALLCDLDELRRDCRAIALAGNASTTAVIAAIERGASIEAGIRHAQATGVLEPDPELDLSGADAATKVVAVAHALWQRPIALDAVVRRHLRELDVAELRHRFRAGRTTRLVARAEPGAAPRVAFEALPRTSPLAVPATHVAYTYTLAGGTTRVHTGHSLGAERTAAALCHDLRALALALAPAARRCGAQGVRA